jgi:hypothetical protein
MIGTIGASGGLKLALTASSGATASLSEAITVPLATNVWSASMGFTYPGNASWQATVQEDSTTYEIYMQPPVCECPPVKGERP